MENTKVVVGASRVPIRERIEQIAREAGIPIIELLTMTVIEFCQRVEEARGRTKGA